MYIKVIPLLAFICILGVNAERGYMFTSPRRLEKGATNYFRLHLYQINASGKFNIELRANETNDNKTIASKEYNIAENTEQIHFEYFVPYVSNDKGKLILTGNFTDGYTFSGEEVVPLYYYRRASIFIQTDKPLYKPGQEVKFRILVLDERLKPFGGNPVGTAMINDPKHRKVAEWNDIPLGNGIRQLQFSLSEEAELGKWSIFVGGDYGMQMHTFFVREYVLPKFQITITPPNYVLSIEETFPVEICAKYTYGKPLEGILKINITKDLIFYKSPTVKFNTQLNGCYTYLVNISHLFINASYSYDHIEIDVSVEENGTGIIQTDKMVIPRYNLPLNLFFHKQSLHDFFKPGLPYSGKITAKNPDLTAAPNELIEFCATVTRERTINGWWATRKITYCTNYTTEENGDIFYVIPPQDKDAVNIKLTAKYMTQRNTMKYEFPAIETVLRPAFSSSGNYIQIESHTRDFFCDKNTTLNILFNTEEEEGTYTFFYQISARGDVLYSNSFEYTFSKEDEVSWKYKESMNTTRVQIFPYEENDDGSSSKDSKPIQYIHEVDVDIKVIKEMSPTFRFLVYYIREDLEIIADFQKFEVEKCLKNKVELEFTDKIKHPGSQTTLKLKATPDSVCGIKVVDKSVLILDPFKRITKDQLLSYLVNDDKGLYLPSQSCKDSEGNPKNPTVNKKPYKGSLKYQDALASFELFGNLVMSNFVLLTQPCVSSKTPSVGVETIRNAIMALKNIRPFEIAAVQPAGPISRNPIFKIQAIDSTIDVRSYFPETWLFQMEIIGSSGEKVWTETLPHSITEWRGNAICIHKDDGIGLSDEVGITGFQDFFISLAIPYSIIRGEKFTIAAKAFNYLNHTLPMIMTIEEGEGFIVGGSSSMEFCLPGGHSDTFPIQLEATSLGKLNLTVRAVTKGEACDNLVPYNKGVKDAVLRTIRVEPEGYPHEDIRSFIFCPKEEENGKYEKDFSFALPKDLVPESARAYLQITGDIIGPVSHNFEVLLHIPTGCGEQNLMYFIPNVLILNYLETIGRLTNELKDKVIRNLNKGAQSQMKFRRYLGSYSAFGDIDEEGSIIVTALVLQSFAMSNKYITIDEHQFEETMDWVLSKQTSDGCFPEVGHTVGPEFKHIIGDHKDVVTAFVLNSLLIAGLKDHKVIDSALACMQTKEEHMTPFKTSLYVYTSVLAGNSTLVEKYMIILNTLSIREGDEIYFRNVNGSASIDVQTAAYAILAILKSGRDIQEAFPMVKWITNFRNGQGGFISTQDTYIGLEALTEFSSRIRKSPIDLSITLSGNLDTTFEISEERKDLFRRYKIPDLSSHTSFVAEGSGCGLVQVVLSYNTISSPNKTSFSLHLGKECFDGIDCKKVKLYVCTRYLIDGKKSSMALIEVKMISGMAASVESLKMLYKVKGLDLMLHEIENNNVIFYFYEITNDYKCFNFVIEEIIHVENRKPALAKVYDYYAKENAATVSYTLKRNM